MGLVEKAIKIGVASSILASTGVGEVFMVKDGVVPSFQNDRKTQVLAGQLKDKEHELLLTDPEDISGRRTLQQEIRGLEDVRNKTDQGFLPLAYVFGAAAIPLAGAFSTAAAVEGVSVLTKRISRKKANKENPSAA